MSDTPQTDAFDKGTFGPRREQWVEFARRLERERDSLREENRKLREALELCLSRIETHTLIILTNADMIAMESARNALK